MVTASQSSLARPGPAVGWRDLFGLLSAHLSSLDRFLLGQLDDFEPEIRQLARHCLDTSGKRIRPALVFFSGWQEDGRVSPELVRLAAVIEMVHLATLVHDDIMDHAEVRRGRRTAAREFGINAAVLLGDALFAHALSVAASFPTTEVCQRVSISTRRVCSGEIMQTLASGDVERGLAYYHRVIDLKTAELFSVSCLLGSRLAGVSGNTAEAAGEFGRRLGTAYQIYDDLADFFGDEPGFGKTLGTDLASGKLTLPLLLLLERLPPEEAAHLRREIREGDTGNFAQRVDQMARLGVAADTLGAIRREIQSGEAALHAAGLPGAERLMQLAGLLDAQAEGLAR